MYGRGERPFFRGVWMIIYIWMYIYGCIYLQQALLKHISTMINIYKLVMIPVYVNALTTMRVEKCFNIIINI